MSVGAHWGPRAVVLAALLLPFGAVSADIYKYVDKYGRVTLTDKASRGGGMKLVKTWKGWVAKPVGKGNPNLVRDRKKYSATISQAARRTRLPVELVHAVVSAESAYNPDAVSRAGAVGLMQLMPETAKRYGVANSYDPAQNVSGGTRYLSDLMGMFNNNVILAVAAYNAGENAVIQYGNKVPPYSETQQYVRRVVQYFKQYAKDSAAGKVAAKPRVIKTGVAVPAPRVAVSNTAASTAVTRTRTIGDPAADNAASAVRIENVRGKPVDDSTVIWPRPKNRVAVIKWADEEQ